ncbi:MAG TPA: porin [Gammaproteobacteria bacterium]|nr:porin [Gammaproteobacteria bacterium]
MRMQKTLLSVAVAAGLSAASLPAAAAPLGATVYGDLALALVNQGSAGAGTQSNTTLNDNVSLLGVRGDAAVMDGTKFIYDFNFILDMAHGGANPSTHLGYIGLAGPYGTVTAGRDNGLFVGMVDGSTYQTNWFYTPGMSALQVDTAVKYVSPTYSGFQFGVQAFDLGKSANSTTNYTVAGTYGMGPLTFGAGYTGYSKYGDGSSEYTVSSDTNQFGEPTNTFAGVLLKSKFGVSAGYKMGPFGVVAAYDSRKPSDGFVSYMPVYSAYAPDVQIGTTPAVSPQNTKAINTVMLTGSYAATSEVTLVGNWSHTNQSGTGGVKGNIVTLMASYAPADNLFFSLEFQHSDKDANATGITGATYGGGTESSNAIAVGATYSF